MYIYIYVFRSSVSSTRRGDEEQVHREVPSLTGLRNHVNGSKNS